jgi:hypothetical protein
MGKQGTSTFNMDTLAAGSDQFIEYCPGNRAVKAPDSMAKASKR